MATNRRRRRGGGLGAGGAIFVQEGGRLTIQGGSLSGGTVQGGQGVDGGQECGGRGSGIFMQGSETLILAPGLGQILTIDDDIVDQKGGGGSDALIDGPGTVRVDGLLALRE